VNRSPVLLVTDEARFRDVLSEALLNYGFDVVTARDTGTAEDLLPTLGPVDIVVLSQEELKSAESRPPWRDSSSRENSWPPSRTLSIASRRKRYGRPLCS
jgi:hypothetical protein